MHALLTKQTATFVPARKYSQENTAKTARKRLKGLLGALAETRIALIAVAPTDKASFVYSYVQTRLMGQCNGK